jgi:hypothetical protein
LAFPTTAPLGGPLVTGTLTLINGVNYIYDATSISWSPVSTTNSLTLGSLSVNSLTSLSSLDVQGSETVSGNITAQGLVSGSNTNYTYGLPTVGATVDWIKVGRFTAPQSGAHCYVKIVTSTGISAVTGQQTEIHIHFSTSNSVAVDANGFGGFTQYYVTNTNTSAYAVKVVSNSAGVSATYYDMWYYQPGINNGTGSFYTVEINESVSNWDHVGITATALNVAAPGAASNTISVGVNSRSLQSNLGIGVTPTAKLHIAAGTTTVAPLLLTSGTSLTTPVNGSMEYDGTSLYFTPSTATRKAIAYADGTNITFPTNGTVTTVSVASANGFAGTVSSASTTPAITISTSITGILKGNATAVSAATAGTDYLAPPSGTSILKANNSGALANATAGTDYSAGTSALTTGILKSTTTTGALSIAAAGTDYQAPLPSQTGNSGKYLTTDGSALSWATVTAGGSMVYPGSGIANSTGSAWGTSYSVSGSGDVVLTTSPTFTTSIDSGATFGAFASSTTLTLGYNSTLASTINISTGAVAASTIKTINIGTGGAASSTTNVTIGAIAGTLTIGTGTLVGTNITQNVFNTTATTVNAFGAATSLTLGMSSLGGTVNLATGAASLAPKNINIGTGGGTASTTNITIGASNSLATTTTNIYGFTKLSKASASSFSGSGNTGTLTITDSANTSNWGNLDWNTGNQTAPYARIGSNIITRGEGTTSGVKGGHVWIGTNNITNFQMTVTGATFASNVMTLTFLNTGVALWSTGGTITVAGLTPSATSGTVVNVNGTFTVLTCTTTQVTYTLTSAGTYTWTSGGTITGFYGGASGVSGVGAAGDGINNYLIVDSKSYLSIGGQVYPTWPITIGNVSGVNILSFVSNGTTTAYNFVAIANTTGTLYFGVETSTGGGLFTGSAAYSTIVGTRSVTSMHLVTNSNIAQTIDSSGRVTKPLQPSFQVRGDGTSTLTVATITKDIYMTVVDHNVGSMWTPTGTPNNRFTCLVAGVYYIYYHAALAATQSGTRELHIYKNGSAYLSSYLDPSTYAMTWTPLHVSGSILLAVNDYIEFYAKGYVTPIAARHYAGGYLLG